MSCGSYHSTCTMILPQIAEVILIEMNGLLVLVEAFQVLKGLDQRAQFGLELQSGLELWWFR